MASPAPENRLSLPRLNRDLLRGGHVLPANVALPDHRTDRPIRVLQFGEGNFLRGFADWMIDVANRKGVFDGSVAIVQPRAGGIVRRLVEQEGLYTLVLRGMAGGRAVDERCIVGSVRVGIDPYTDFPALLALGREPDLRFVLSNTTEAGLATSSDDRVSDTVAPPSFTAKLTAVLHARWRHFDGDPAHGLIHLPCELVESNGQVLRRLVLETAHRWSLQQDFIDWVTHHNVFCDTLVDRIVSGYPAPTQAERFDRELGYHDSMLVTAEPYHLFAIAAPPGVEQELPLHQAGLNVVWTSDLRPIRELKVRLLNGAHTAMVPVAFLAGHDTVFDAITDPAIGQFVERIMIEEIVPTLERPRDEAETYASSVLDRFRNPHNRHELLAIALNSISKFRVRLLPSLKAYHERFNQLPERITFALAALIAFYRSAGNDPSLGRRGDATYPLRDEPQVLTAFAGAWGAADNEGLSRDQVVSLLARSDVWGDDLTSIPGLIDRVHGLLHQIQEQRTAGRFTGPDILSDSSRTSSRPIG